MPASKKETAVTLGLISVGDKFRYDIVHKSDFPDLAMEVSRLMEADFRVRPVGGPVFIDGYGWFQAIYREEMEHAS